MFNHTVRKPNKPFLLFFPDRIYSMTLLWLSKQLLAIHVGDKMSPSFYEFFGFLQGFGNSTPKLLHVWEIGRDRPSACVGVYVLRS